MLCWRTQQPFCLGVLGGQPCLEYEAKEFEKIISVNTNGVFYTAQAAGRQSNANAYQMSSLIYLIVVAL